MIHWVKAGLAGVKIFRLNRKTPAHLVGRGFLGSHLGWKRLYVSDWSEETGVQDEALDPVQYTSEVG